MPQPLLARTRSLRGFLATMPNKVARELVRGAKPPVRSNSPRRIVEFGSAPPPGPKAGISSQEIFLTPQIVLI